MKKLRLLFLASLFFSLASPASYAQDAPAKPAPTAEKALQDTFDVLMGAIQDDSYSSFLTAVDDDFKAALTKPLFESVVASVAPRQKKGFQATYLGVLNRQGYSVHLWRLVFQDKGDDVLAQMSVKDGKDGKVGGFFLQ